MSFSFGFKNDDIDETVEEIEMAMPERAIQERSAAEIPLPTLHKLRDMLEVLPSKIWYSTVQVSGYDGPTINIPRRELFDIRRQLMAETPMSGQSATPGLTADDITPNVYEGGFKTWECSLDLANYLATQQRKHYDSHQSEDHFIEVGAGTALPTLVLFHYFLERSVSEWRAIHISVADYNQSVLETATIPNLLLTWFFARSLVAPPPEGDLDITQDLLSRFLRDLSGRLIYVSGISGPWNQAFLSIVRPFDDPLRRTNIGTTFLASETIYSPSSIGAFTEVLIGTLRAAEKAHGRARALIAAKRVYFGVGGGVDEFLKVVSEFGGRATSVWESEGPGVERVILEVVSID